MICPRCLAEVTTVKKTIKSFKVIRFRKCPKCNYKWITEEKPASGRELAEYVKRFEEDGEDYGVRK
ncbi:MAG: hypothetical protein LBI57_03975 [Helicobacteraceae bacterium]|jgi:transposase-like protein|nr:hypothetical protein [Helicobacteraceae bacterium]